MLYQKLGQLLKKHCVRSEGHISSPTIMKLGQNLCLDEVSDELENGHVGSKARSHNMFSPIIMKPGQNICLDEISEKVGTGSCLVKN